MTAAMVLLAHSCLADYAWDGFSWECRLHGKSSCESSPLSEMLRSKSKQPRFKTASEDQAPASRNLLATTSAGFGFASQKKVWKCSYMGNGPLDISTGHSNGCTPSPLKGTKLFTPIDDSFGAFNEYLMALINSKSTTKWGGMGSSAYYGPGRENIGSCCKLHLDWGLYVPPTKPTTAGDPMVLITNSDGTGPYEIRGTNDCTNYAWCKKWQTQFSGFLGAVLSFEAAQATIVMAAAGACGSWSRCT